VCPQLRGQPIKLFRAARRTAGWLLLFGRHAIPGFSVCSCNVRHLDTSVKDRYRLCHIYIPASGLRQAYRREKQGDRAMATKTFDRLNPLTGKVATSAPAFTPAEAGKA